MEELLKSKQDIKKADAATWQREYRKEHPDRKKAANQKWDAKFRSEYQKKYINRKQQEVVDKLNNLQAILGKSELDANTYSEASVIILDVIRRINKKYMGSSMESFMKKRNLE